MYHIHCTNKTMILVDAVGHSEQRILIRYDNWPRSAERCRDVGNAMNFRKSQGIPSGPNFKTPLYFFESVKSTLMTRFLINLIFDIKYYI
jgi:hypothetical protein